MSKPSIPPATASTVQHRPLAPVIAHWVTVALLLVAVGTIFAREFIDATSLRKDLLMVHQQAGLLVLGVVVLRLVLRLATRTPERPLAGSVAQQWAARAVHFLLYAAVIALPVLGWAAVGARGEKLVWLGVTLPSWVSERDLDVADELLERHQAAAWALLALFLVHVGAALWHHFVVRDDVLTSMSPWRRRITHRTSTPREERP
jgi:cytochrome b561